MDHQTMHSTLRKNPSRQTCETIIKRILMTEVLEKGTNRHFKQASDFMSYFESLYPAFRQSCQTGAAGCQIHEYAKGL